MNTNIEKAQKARAEKSLDKFIRHNGATMTRREWVEVMFNSGKMEVRISTRNRVKYNRNVFNRMMSYAEQAEYEKKCNEIISCYTLQVKEGSSFWEVSKAEFDYFNSLFTAKK